MDHSGGWLERRLPPGETTPVTCLCGVARSPRLSWPTPAAKESSATWSQHGIAIAGTDRQSPATPLPPQPPQREATGGLSENQRVQAEGNRQWKSWWVRSSWTIAPTALVETVASNSSCEEWMPQAKTRIPVTEYKLSAPWVRQNRDQQASSSRCSDGD